MGPESHVLLIGDTILNRTYRARPVGALGARVVPPSFMNEEYFELAEGADDGADDSVQGVGYIARHLAACRPAPRVTAWTDVGQGAIAREIARFFQGECERGSHYALGCDRSRLVIRIFRDVGLARLSREPKYRSQIRVDSPPAGPATRLEELMADLPAPGFSLALVRAASAEFFAHPWSGQLELTDDDLAHTEARVNAIQRWLQQHSVRAVIDLRPIPPGFRAVARDTIVCTTIGRLRDRLDEGHEPLRNRADAERVVLECFWRFAPVQAIVCYAGEFGTVVCQRGPHFTDAVVQTITGPGPLKGSSDIGMVTGGDAFVAGLVDGLRPGGEGRADLVLAACRAHLCLGQALALPLGRPVDPSAISFDAIQALRGASDAPRQVPNPRLSLLSGVLDSIEGRRGDLMTVPGLVSPSGGKTAEALERLGTALDNWKPQKGKDLIAVFGESRSGKEFALTQTLAAKGYKYVGPVNMHQFLRETGAIVNLLRKLVDPADPASARRAALLIDEIQPDDSARPLLNLMAEKSYTWYARRGRSLDFLEHPVFLMSSIQEGRLLDDLQGRIFERIRIPPLRERIEELPYLLPFAVSNAIGKAAAARTRVRVSFRCLEALLAYDYLPRTGDNLEPGLSQRNFRALDDLTREAIGRARQRGRADADQVTLHAEDLPRLLVSLVGGVTPEEDYVEYGPGYKVGTHPNVIRRP